MRNLDHAEYGEEIVSLRQQRDEIISVLKALVARVQCHEDTFNHSEFAAAREVIELSEGVIE